MLTRAPDSAVSLNFRTAEMTREDHDFDWQLGRWRLETSRLEHPLKEGGKWIPLTGTVDVERVWGGRANLAEIHLDGASSHLEFLSLRLYNPNAHQWSLNFASSGDATLSTPMVGEFQEWPRGILRPRGRGRPIDVRPLRVRRASRAVRRAMNRLSRPMAARRGKSIGSISKRECRATDDGAVNARTLMRGHPIDTHRLLR